MAPRSQATIKPTSTGKSKKKILSRHPSTGFRATMRNDQEILTQRGFPRMISWSAAVVAPGVRFARPGVIISKLYVNNLAQSTQRFDSTDRDRLKQIGQRYEQLRLWIDDLIAAFDA